MRSLCLDVCIAVQHKHAECKGQECQIFGLRDMLKHKRRTVSLVLFAGIVMHTGWKKKQIWEKKGGWSDDDEWPNQHQSEPKLTFRDILTVQQTGVSVNVILWAQRKKKKSRDARVKAAEEKQFVSVRLKQKC